MNVKWFAFALIILSASAAITERLMELRSDASAILFVGACGFGLAALLKNLTD